MWESTEYSVLCSQHFKKSCSEVDILLTQSLGLGKERAALKHDAIVCFFISELYTAESKTQVYGYLHSYSLA